MLQGIPPDYVLVQFDGVLGLALNDTISDTSPFYNMIGQDLIALPVFSFHLGTDPLHNYATFGAIDSSAYEGDLSYVPCTSKGRWEVDLPKISFGDDELDLESGTSATVDTDAS